MALRQDEPSSVRCSLRGPYPRASRPPAARPCAGRRSSGLQSREARIAALIDAANLLIRFTPRSSWVRLPKAQGNVGALHAPPSRSDQSKQAPRRGLHTRQGTLFVLIAIARRANFDRQMILLQPEIVSRFVIIQLARTGSCGLAESPCRRIRGSFQIAQGTCSPHPGHYQRTPGRGPRRARVRAPRSLRRGAPECGVYQPLRSEPWHSLDRGRALSTPIRPPA